MAIRQDINPDSIVSIVKDGVKLGFISRDLNGCYFWNEDAMKVLRGIGKAHKSFTSALEIPANKYNVKLSALKVVED